MAAAYDHRLWSICVDYAEALTPVWFALGRFSDAPPLLQSPKQSIQKVYHLMVHLALSTFYRLTRPTVLMQRLMMYRRKDVVDEQAFSQGLRKSYPIHLHHRLDARPVAILYMTDCPGFEFPHSTLLATHWHLRYN